MKKYNRLLKKEKRELLYGYYINHRIKEVVGISFEVYCKEYIKSLI